MSAAYRLGIFFALAAFALLNGTKATGKPAAKHKSAPHPTVGLVVNFSSVANSSDLLLQGHTLFVRLTEDLGRSLPEPLSWETNASPPMRLTVREDGNTVILEERSRILRTSAGTIKLPAAPFRSGDALFVPIRSLFSTLGYEVYWGAREHRIYLSKKAIVEQVTNAEIEGIMVRISKRETSRVVVSAPPSQIEHSTETLSTPPPKVVNKSKFEFTYDNTIGFENTAVSGLSDQSNLVPRSIVTNQFNFRFQTQLENGYQLGGNIRTLGTSEDTENPGQLTKLSLTMEKEDASLTFYDMYPKFSYYLMKNYQVRGIQYNRTNNLFSLSFLHGESPKIAGDSEYSRYVSGFQIHRSKTKDRDLGITFIRTKDTGAPLVSDQLDNQVLALNAAGKSGKKIRYFGEMALSRTETNGISPALSKARTFQAQYRDPTTICSMVYERNGQEFDTETAMTTSGRRELSVLVNRRLSARSMTGLGAKSVRLGDEETTSIPVIYTITPTTRRPKMKWTFQRNYEKARNYEGPRITDSRVMIFADQIGSVHFDFNNERRRLKEKDGAMQFRSMRRLRFDLPVQKKTEMSVQHKWERRSSGANPLTRFTQVQFVYELAEWAELSFGGARYYNATLNNRTSFNVGLRKMDIVNDTETNLAYEFYNYRDHNDNVIRVSYGLFR